MKFRYDKETDSLFIRLREGQYVESDEIASGFVIDFDSEGNVIALDIDHASKRIDLNSLEVFGMELPITTHADMQTTEG